MNPIFLNCLFLYIIVVLLSVFQSRFLIIKERPWLFFLLLILLPLLVFAKASKIRTWTGLTGLEIFMWTLVLAYTYPRHIVPRINEGYIYAYTLLHWYLLVDTVNRIGFNFWTAIVCIISVYPTFLILKHALVQRRLSFRDKLTLYYWFLFTIFFTYADQIALDIIRPILLYYEVSVNTTIYVLITAIQLYFISVTCALVFVGIPVFHMDRSWRSFSVRWKDAMKDWREIANHKLNNYIEYQINALQLVYITIASAALFFFDQFYEFRLYLIFIYTVGFPLLFFFFKWTPAENLEKE